MEETKMKVTVSAFDPNTKCPYVSVSDEAFALLLLENYLTKWKYQWQCDQDNKQYQRQPGRYTSSNAGHVELYNAILGWCLTPPTRISTWECSRSVTGRTSTGMWWSEAIPPNAPEPRGKEVDLRLFMDSDHAGEKLTRRSRANGVHSLLEHGAHCVVLQEANNHRNLCLWHRIRHDEDCDGRNAGTTLQTTDDGHSPFGTDIILWRQHVGHTQHTTTRITAMQEGECHQLPCHAIREAVAMGELLTGHIRSEENPADLCTKVIPGRVKRNYLLDKILYDLTDYSECVFFQTVLRVPVPAPAGRIQLSDESITQGSLWVLHSRGLIKQVHEGTDVCARQTDGRQIVL